MKTINNHEPSQRLNPLNDYLFFKVSADEKSPPELVAEVANMDSAIMAANERQYFVIQDEEARRAYWSVRKAEHDRISNLNGERREGREEKAIEIARKMKEMGDPIERIHTITGLPTETIERM